MATTYRVVSAATATVMGSSGRCELSYTPVSEQAMHVKSLHLSLGGTNAAGTKAVFRAIAAVISSAGTATGDAIVSKVAGQSAIGRGGTGKYSYTTNPTLSAGTTRELGNFQVAPTQTVVWPLNAQLAPGESLLVYQTGSTESLIAAADLELA